MAVARGTAFEYIAIYHPKTKKDKVGDEVVEKSRLISDGVQIVVAVSPDEAQLRAARALPAEYEDKLDDVEIIVRPFGSA